MTRDKILAMEPGLRLDSLVGYKVLKRMDARIFWPKYSTDINAAWRVLDKLKQIYHVQLDGKPKLGWRLALFDHDGMPFYVGDYYPEPAEAICKASLIEQLERP